ncbi:EAL domain-containing protein [Hahella sp. HN01]|uniref:EAL domain-containing protein n=1 Tax=Hahella sp. HN01 TaxID=2847262 RepID=UPI001C1E98CD|nr:EAL domain-containing protein [Hahella sp. HN01]MBU6953911.1 EAL domain-containing protein [Hahella sp. HN01]
MIDNNKALRDKRSIKVLMLGLISTMLLILLGGVFGLNLWQKKLYLQDQLQSHARDSATSLGLSVSHVADPQDWVVASSMVDAIFDSGAYQGIRIIDQEGRSVVARTSSKDLEGVPKWFVRWLDLQAPVGEAEVIAGWRPVGRLMVQSDPGIAYRELWATLRNQLAWFAVVTVFAFAAFHLLLSSLLRPLQRLEQAAHRIEDKHFDVSLPIPGTRELAKVTLAVNSMADHLRRSFEEQVATIESLRKLALLDSVTGVLNRQSFDNRLQAALAGDDGDSVGALLLAQLSGLSEYNDQFGREQGDALLKQMAEVIHDECLSHIGSYVGRRGGGCFTVFLSGLTDSRAEAVAERLLERLTSLPLIKNWGGSNRLHIGVVNTEGRTPLAQVLSVADFAMRVAQKSCTNAWRKGRSSGREAGQKPLTATEWQSLLLSTLADKGFYLHFQPVLSDDSRSFLFHQALVRMNMEGRVLAAAEFLPMADRFNLALKVDAQVLEDALTRLAEHHEDAAFCVSLAVSSMQSAEFAGLASAILHRFSAQCPRLLLEVSEHALQAAWAGFDRLLQLRNELAFRIVISRFGSTGMPFGYLKSCPVDMIKIDPGLVKNIHKDQGHQFYLRSIVQIAHSQAIKVIGVGVESQDDWDSLVQLGVDGAMGYYLFRPQESPPHMAAP